MILTWQLARAVSWLKRIAKAVEQFTSDVHEILVLYRSTVPQRRPPIHTHFDVADPRDWQAQYEKDHPDE